MQLSLIAAMTPNHVIGFQNTLPWHLPADLAHFRALTIGKTVIMGRLTYSSIGKPLPKRRNIILSAHLTDPIPGCEVYSSLEAALAVCVTEQEVIVIGGANVFAQTLPLATTMYLTLIDCNQKGDCYFPNWNNNEWQITQSTFYAADKSNAYDMLMLEYKRVV